jgi:hypothetical protein
MFYYDIIENFILLQSLLLHLFAFEIYLITLLYNHFLIANCILGD